MTEESVGDLSWIPENYKSLVPKLEKNAMPALSEQAKADWVFFSLGLGWSPEEYKLKLEIYGLNPRNCKVYHVIDFKLDDYRKSSIVPLEDKELPEDIAFSALGTELFVVAGATRTFYTCDISGPGPHTWEEGPSLICSKSRPLLFVLGHKLYVLSTCAFVGNPVVFEMLDLWAEEKKKRKRWPDWQALSFPPMLRSTQLYYAIDQQNQKIYFPSTEWMSLFVFNSYENEWDRYCKTDEKGQIDPLIFNLMRLPPWHGFAPIVYDKIYLVEYPYWPPPECQKLPPECQESLVGPTKLGIVSYNLKALAPTSSLEGDLSYMTPKRVAGLHPYLTYPIVHDEFYFGALAYVGEGCFCYAGFFRDIETSLYLSSIAATVFKLSLDDMKGDFPDEVERVNEFLRIKGDFPHQMDEMEAMNGYLRNKGDFPHEVENEFLDDPVLRPQGDVVQSYYKFAFAYFSSMAQVGKSESYASHLDI